ncbi:hypothetical protein BCR33DRAFT_741535 [Rhizoclosmatium globosum]|uniref:Uncharacterized protein n=1 Tax=Rhizoclosmatium globosum TaxID=329046 RepID=A0A1Y2BVP2_9FUNG|nr:hypothetical protein BCR33DRAFT_741535 [Rhizoclosmatium globosum]|eukprot:ORY38697.1 hypothetical protein BCR33DRAFT_741535 [Rhizoclosmatium globosum]
MSSMLPLPTITTTTWPSTQPSAFHNNPVFDFPDQFDQAIGWLHNPAQFAQPVSSPLPHIMHSPLVSTPQVLGSPMPLLHTQGLVSQFGDTLTPFTPTAPPFSPFHGNAFGQWSMQLPQQQSQVQMLSVGASSKAPVTPQQQVDRAPFRRQDNEWLTLPTTGELDFDLGRW